MLNLKSSELPAEQQTHPPKPIKMGARGHVFARGLRSGLRCANEAISYWRTRRVLCLVVNFDLIISPVKFAS